MKIPGTGFPCLALALSVLVVGCSPEPEQVPTPEAEPVPTATIVDDAAMADEASGANWLAFGRTYSEQRYSPLEQVNTSNVGKLGVDWYADLPNDRGLVSTPLVVDGVLYFIGSMNRVRAVGATTGELFWEYDPQVVAHTGNDLRACRSTSPAPRRSSRARY